LSQLLIKKIWRLQNLPQFEGIDWSRGANELAPIVDNMRILKIMEDFILVAPM